MAADWIDRIGFFVTGLLVSLLCLTLVLDYSAGARAEALPLKSNTLATGTYHSIYIKSDGSLWARGENTSNVLPMIPGHANTLSQSLVFTFHARTL